MHRKLLDVLVDPASGEPLALVDDDGREWIEEGELVAPGGARYPIVRGVPRFVDSEAYSGSFGLQWNRFATVQLDSVSGSTVSRERFDSDTGWGANDIKGQWVVDCGCGAGRFAEIAAEYGAEVIAVDLSSAVDAVRENLGQLPNVHPVQADIRSLPVRSDAVTHLYSIGVLQHTPDAVASARALVEPLSPGARFALVIYGRKRWTKLNAKYWVRPLTRRIPPERLLAIIERVMPVLFPLTNVLFRVPVLGRFFQFVIPVANYLDRPGLNPSVRYDQAVLDTFDMLAPRYDNPATASEIDAGLRPLADLRFRSFTPVVVHGARRAREHRGT